VFSLDIGTPATNPISKMCTSPQVYACFFK